MNFNCQQSPKIWDACNTWNGVLKCILQSLKQDKAKGTALFIYIYIYVYIYIYRKTSNTSRTKSQKLNVSRHFLHLSLPNPLKPCVKSRMKM